MKKKLLTFLKVVVPTIAFYFLVSPIVAPPLYNALLFYPTESPAEAYDLAAIENVPKQDVSIPSSEQSVLHGWFFRLPGAKQVALIHHGNGGNLLNRTYLVETLLRAGCSVLVYDYQGYGKSTGSPSVPRILDDGYATYDYTVKKLGFRPDDIVLVGESLGCGVATEVAKQRPSAGIILQSGFTALPDMARERYELLNVYPNSMFPPAPQTLDSARNLRDIHVPVLLVHGKKDGAIPLHHGQANFAAANEPKTLYVVDGAGHNDCYDVGGAAYEDAFKTFIRQINDKHVARTAK